MMRICSWCKHLIGIKPPFENKLETGGICQSCWEKVMPEMEYPEGE